jgi:hypothetical protein
MQNMIELLRSQIQQSVKGLNESLMQCPEKDRVAFGNFMQRMAKCINNKDTKGAEKLQKEIIQYVKNGNKDNQ